MAQPSIGPKHTGEVFENAVREGLIKNAQQEEEFGDFYKARIAEAKVLFPRQLSTQQ